MPARRKSAWHEKIARISLEDEKDRRSPKDNAPWLDADKKDLQ
jgi:hypothetical protein